MRNVRPSEANRIALETPTSLFARSSPTAVVSSTLMTIKYLLPSFPGRRCVDRFSIVESSEFMVEEWAVISTLLRRSVKNTTGLVDLLETISLTLHDGQEASDYATLLSFLNTSVLSVAGDEDLQGDFFARIWPSLVAIALEMPNLFPSGSLPSLSHSTPTVYLTKQQIVCLVVHQFFGTLDDPQWKKPGRGESRADIGATDFTLWYTDNQPHPRAVHAYLSALFAYFSRVTSHPLVSTDTLSFHLSSPALPSLPGMTPLLPLMFERVEDFTTSPRFLGLPGGAALIGANRRIGFGHSGTQEEIHFGASPEACIGVLLAPPLRDHEVLVVRGAEAMVNIRGYGRSTELESVLPKGSGVNWAERTMLLADALELDDVDASTGLPDLLPGNVRRELHKLYAAFVAPPGVRSYTHVVAGAWGCGAFGGNVEVKALVMWCAAALAGVKLHLVFEQARAEVADQLEGIQDEVRKMKWSAEAVINMLERLRPEDAVEKKFCGIVREKLSTPGVYGIVDSM